MAHAQTGRNGTRAYAKPATIASALFFGASIALFATGAAHALDVQAAQAAGTQAEDQDARAEGSGAMGASSAGEHENPSLDAYAGTEDPQAQHARSVLPELFENMDAGQEEVPASEEDDEQAETLDSPDGDAAPGDDAASDGKTASDSSARTSGARHENGESGDDAHDASKPSGRNEASGAPSSTGSTTAKANSASVATSKSNAKKTKAKKAVSHKAAIAKYTPTKDGFVIRWTLCPACGLKHAKSYTETVER